MSRIRRIASAALEGVATCFYFTWYAFMCGLCFLFGCDVRRELGETEDGQ